MKILYIILVSIIIPVYNNEYNDLEVVDYVDFNSYMGTWYEIARLPNSFEKGMICIKSDYSLRDDGRINILNTGRAEKNPTKIRELKGIAWVPDKRFIAKLKVRYQWPLSGDYWIIDIGKNYEYAMVGTPSRRYFWILSRTREMDEKLYNKLIVKAGRKGFNISKIVRINQRYR